MAINKKQHAQWSSSFGFVLAAVGSAVGLGNIWKFPYMVGESGGSAFVIAYLFCIALIGFPILVAEWFIGRRGQKNPINTFMDVAESEGRSRSWGIVGASGILGGFLILSFYSVIGGWALNYITKTGSGAFVGQDSDAVGATFDAMLASAGTLTIWHTVFMIITALIVGVGVTKGIEAASKILMPLLGIILFVIVGYNVVSGGFGEAFSYLFAPDLSKLNSQIVLAALGHAFFTLSIGMGIMVAYGSYLGQEVNLLKTARLVIILDTVIALAAGLAIFPIIFSNGLDPASGPGLIFVSLPIAFGKMTGGTIIGAMFFLLITFAAVTSSISLLEPSVELLEERTSLNRTMATVVAAVVVWLLGIAALLSFNLWSDVLIMGNNIFDALDKLTSKFLLPITGLAGIIFFAWRMNQDAIRVELNLSGTAWQVWQVVSKFIAPIAVLVVFVTTLIGMG